MTAKFQPSEPRCNIGSAAVIEQCGGTLESVGPDENGVIFRRYWV